jgi:hypothetical protein
VEDSSPISPRNRSDVLEAEARKRGDGVNALTFSNRWFNPDAARLYEERLQARARR